MLNTISLYGRLTKTPELRRTPNGKAVASFTIAVDRDNKETGCDFINCVAWEGAAEFVTKYFAKGDAMVVTGRLQTRNYEDSAGNKRTAVEVLVVRAYFGGSKKEANSAAPVSFEELDDEPVLPF